MRRLIIFVSGEPTSEQRSLSSLAELMGISSEFVTFKDWEHRIERSSTAAAVSASTIKNSAHCNLLREFSYLFIFGHEPQGNPEHKENELLRCARKVSFRDCLTTTSYPSSSRPFTKQLAGVELERVPSSFDAVFDSELEGVEIIMKAGQSPVFVLQRLGKSQVFHLARTAPLPDPNSLIPEGSVAGMSHLYLPVLIFLKVAFPEEYWSNPNHTARLIIDDPILKRQYGFLAYEKLFRIAKVLKFGVTTAFIPWNYQRTSMSNATFFLNDGVDHSICVHGCDHTNHEFSSTNVDIIEKKAVTALSRLRAHQTRTGIPFDRVMVFPQGKFSPPAMRALRKAGFIAAINSTRVPTQIGEVGLKLSDELVPAATCYSGLPLFSRRYPSNLNRCALDLFLGKPAYIVEHHEWFAKGFEDLERCVIFLNGVEPGLTWPCLDVAVQKQFLYRKAGDLTEVRFFTSEFSFQSGSESLIRFTKPDPEGASIREARINGKNIDFNYSKGLVTFMWHAREGERLKIELIDNEAGKPSEFSPGLKYRASVQLRRRLSELRDNHLAKHPRALGMTKRIVKSFKLSADSNKFERK